MTKPLDIAPEVADALAAGRAVVALESTIIAHGMAFPRNLETARQVEAEVRSHGAVPATIAVIDGRLRVGLDGPALERLATAKNVAKASSRDLAVLVAKRATAGTTVAATMRIAAMAGIAVFGTGGIGGVHRGAEASWDVSADLTALAATPVAVVSAGCKSILDIAKTLEFLETHAVPVVGYRTATFPAFFSRDSGYPLEHRADSPAEIAAIIRAQRALGSTAGLLVANPIPDAAALAPAEIDALLAQAAREAGQQAVAGKGATPFLLERMVALSGGRSLDANIALVRNNAALAAEIAVALAGGHA